MLSEREMAMAKDLAKKFAEINQLDEKESYETIICAFQNVKEVFISTWNQLKEIVSSIAESIEGITEGIEKKHAYNWHVPIKTRMPESPFIENHNIQFARNNL